MTSDPEKAALRREEEEAAEESVGTMQRHSRRRPERRHILRSIRNIFLFATALFALSLWWWPAPRPIPPRRPDHLFDHFTSLAGDERQRQMLDEAEAARLSLPAEFNDGKLRLRHVLHHASSAQYRGLFRIHHVDADSPFVQWTDVVNANYNDGYAVRTTKRSSSDSSSSSFTSTLLSALFPSSSAQYNAKAAAHVMPDVTDRTTILSLATMCFDSYTIPSAPDWINIGKDWHVDIDWGWANDGLRGYVFANADNSLAVISFKGTSAGFLGIGGPSSPKDKINDNRMFSCCCAKVSPIWMQPLCGCATSSNVCNSTCIANDVLEPDSYLFMAQKIYQQVATLYPPTGGTTIWLTGHSLGGSVASTLGLSLQAKSLMTPVVAFNAPAERQYAKRLGLEILEPTPAIYHFGVSGDPLFTGACQGPTSPCWLAGYAMETKCHLGHDCIWQSNGSSINMHMIAKLIKDYVLNDALPLPTCQPVNASCTDCDWWQFTPLDGTATPRLLA